MESLPPPDKGLEQVVSILKSIAPLQITEQRYKIDGFGQVVLTTGCVSVRFINPKRLRKGELYAKQEEILNAVFGNFDPHPSVKTEVVMDRIRVVREQFESGGPVFITSDLEYTCPESIFQYGLCSS
jgi:hypothetical protein